jgi:hypothetical protein
MKPTKTIEQLIYALVVALSLAAIFLVINAPNNFLNVHAVYQGF